MASSTPLRIAVVQFAPKIGQVQANIRRARELCRKLQPRSVDLICFPEMIMSGELQFESARSISPYLEHPKTGPTSQFCSELSERIQCFVFAGYPERLASEELNIKAHDSQHETEATADSTTSQIIGANSAVLYGPDGEWVGHYRKTNLFVTDKTWAKPGTAFATLHLPSPLRTVSFGICNDLNATEGEVWRIESGPYELADYAVSQNADTLILLNAWLDSGTEKEEETDWYTLNYWAARLRPLWVGDDVTSEENRSNEATEDGKETIVVVCNRTGEENGKSLYIHQI
ncbi:carbon-nitrogen hydrolase [Rhodocollybia butyracea]|uniref:Carbon-nitrogen hydrolase n=1 Tax=Rhodocollybia butyracea TaxID=206335 RepID=A0A9P5U589_9AGAR|nr:carbon-nitrogen hydrolase [Rhodocollybia butyracea]